MKNRKTIDEIITIYRKMKKGKENQNIYRGDSVYDFAKFTDIRSTKYHLFTTDGRLIQSNDIFNEISSFNKFEGEETRATKKDKSKTRTNMTSFENIHDKIQPIENDAQNTKQMPISNIESSNQDSSTFKLAWLNIFDPSEKDLAFLHQLFSVYELTLADIREKDTEEKIETFKHYTFISLKMLSPNTAIDIDFNILIFNSFVITTHDKPWMGTFDAINFLYLINTHVKFRPDWVAFSIIVEFLQDVKARLKSITTDVKSIVVNDSAKEDLLRSIFEMIGSLHSLKSFIKPKKTIIKMINELTKRARFKSLLNDYISSEEQMNEMIKTLERAQDLLLALVDMRQTREANEMNKVINRFSLITFIFMPCQAISGLWGMNVDVPWKSGGAWPFFILCFVGPIISLLFLVLVKLSDSRKRIKRHSL